MQVAPKTRAYARHEFLSSLGSRFALNTEQERRATVIGLQSEYIQDTDGFTEYRVRDVISGRDAEAAMGLRNRWQILPGLGLHTSLERVQTLSGAVDGDATAAALAVSYTANEDWKGTGRIEYRIGEVQDTLLSTVGLAAKIDDNWSVLGRSLLERASRDTIDRGRPPGPNPDWDSPIVPLRRTVGTPWARTSTASRRTRTSATANVATSTSSRFTATIDTRDDCGAPDAMR